MRRSSQNSIREISAPPANELTITTELDAWRQQLKERAGKYDFLRITEQADGLHVFNIPNEIELCLWREPRQIMGWALYGYIIYKNGRMKYVKKEQFDQAMQYMFKMAEDIRQGND